MGNFDAGLMMSAYWSLPNVVQKSLSNLTWLLPNVAQKSLSNLTSRALSDNKIMTINVLASIQDTLLYETECDFELISLEVKNLFDVRKDPYYKTAIDAFGEKNVIQVSLVSYDREDLEYEKYSTLLVEFNRQLWKLLFKNLPLFAKEFNVVINIGNFYLGDDREDFHPYMSFQEWARWVEREEVNHG